MTHIKGTTSIRRMLFLDTETTSTPAPKGVWRGSGTPMMAKLRLGVMCRWKLNTNNNPSEDWHIFRSIDTFYDLVEGFIGTHRNPVFIYTYNASFDYQVLGLMDAMKQRPNWTYERAPIIGNVFIFETKYKGITVFWLDMGNHLGVKRPLKEIGHDLGMEKLEVDSANLDAYTDEEVEVYCKRDVEIVREYMLKWISFLRDNDLGAYRPTLAGQCLMAYRHKFIEQPIWVHNIPHISALERRSYKGGRNEAFFIGEIPDKVYKLDVNSFHPFIMSSLPLPYRLKRAGRHIDPITIDGYLDAGDVAILDCNISVPQEARCICVREPVEGKTERSIFPIGTYNATITSPEYQQLLRYGGKVNYIDSYAIYAADILFKKYMDFFYTNRLRFKDSGDKTSDTNCKYFMNSLEGKFAQHVKETTVINEDSDRESGDYVVIDASTNERFTVHVYGGREWVSSKTKTEGYEVFVSIPSFIRAYTRVILWEDFNDIWRAGGKVYYTDTDSIFTDEQGYQALMQAGKVDSKRLGAYKLEETSTNTTINGCKDYIFSGKEKIKGVKANATLTNGVYKQTQFCRMTDMLRRGISNGVLIIDEFEKRPTRKYYKGIKGADGWTLPHQLQGE